MMNSKTPIHPVFLLLFLGLLFPCRAAAEDEPVVFSTSFDQPGEYGDLGIRNDMVAAEGHNDSSAFRLNRRRISLPAEAISLNPELHYRLEGAFKAAPGSEGTQVMLGVLFCDENGEQFSSFAVQPVAGTQSVLKEEAVIHAQDVLLENSGQNWPTEGKFAVAFNVMDDHSDLPNQQVFEISSVTVEEDGLRVHFEEPLTADFPAGTPVRWHHLMDPTFVRVTAEADWQEHSLTFGGQSFVGDSPKRMRNKFWPGAKSVLIRLGFSNRESEEQGAEVLVDDLRIVEVSP